MIRSCGFWNVLRIAFSVGLSGFIYGYYSGLINNIHPYLFSPYLFSGFENSLARQLLPFESTLSWIAFSGLASTVTIILLRPRSDKVAIEPRSLATWPCPFFIVGALYMFTFPNYGGYIPGMFIIGWVRGIIFVGSTIYLAEISPTRIRGAMVATFFLQIAAGQIAYYLINLVAALYFDYSFIDDDKEHLEKWHWMLGTVPVLFMFVLRIWVPESPNWLYASGKKEEAIEILRKTRSSIDDVVREVKSLKLEALKEFDQENLPYWSENMIAGFACFVAEHLVGMNMVMYYTPRILIHVLQLDQYSASSKYLMLATLLIKSFLTAIGTLLCIALVDRYGRRRLLLLSTFGIITCLGFLSFVLYGRSMVAVTSTSGIVVATSASCTTGNGDIGSLELLALGALALYFILHSMGIGTIPWIINTEVYPLEVRICFGITASLAYWLTRIYMAAVYIYLDDVFGQCNTGKLFLILCLLSCASFFIIYIYAPETKGYPIEEVEKLLLLEKKSLNDLKHRQVILTSREEIPYMFSSSSSSSSDDE